MATVHFSPTAWLATFSRARPGAAARTGPADTCPRRGAPPAARRGAHCAGHEVLLAPLLVLYAPLLHMHPPADAAGAPLLRP